MPGRLTIGARKPTLSAWAWPHRAAAAADKAIFLARDHVLELVSAALEGSGVLALLVKGVGLAHLYPSAWLRPMSDIDLLLRERDLEGGRRALDRAGFTFEDASDRRRTGPLLELAVRPPPHALQLLIELHIAMDKVVLRPLDIGGLFTRSLPSERFANLHIPTIEDHILLVALHLAADEYRHATGFADLEVLLLAGADLDVVIERARDAHACTALYVAFSTLAGLVPGLVPTSALAALRPSKAHETLLRTTFNVGAWPVPKRPTELGARWFLGQWLLRDDVAAFGLGVAGYAAKRLLERAETIVERLGSRKRT